MILRAFCPDADAQTSPSTEPERGAGRPEYLPEKLKFYIGGHFGFSYSVEWDGEALLYTVWQSSERIGPTVRRIVTAEAAWRKFWKRMDAAKVWQWEECYQSYALDGTQWRVELRRSGQAGKTLISSGNNAYPAEEATQNNKSAPVFTIYRKAVSALLGKEAFE